MASITIVYADGACRSNGHHAAQGGYGLYYGPGDSRNVSEPLLGAVQTNQRAELMAVAVALENHRFSWEPLIIRTDSNYAIMAAASWGDTWERNGYINSSGRPVSNQDLIKRVRGMVRNMNVIFEHVSGHSGDPGNEEADRLAVQGALKGMYHGRYANAY